MQIRKRGSGKVKRRTFAATTTTSGKKSGLAASGRTHGSLTSSTPSRVRKLGLSFEPGLVEQVHRAAAAETGGNVSAWMAEAARERLRQQALVDVVAEYEAKHGAFTEEELAEVDRLWPAKG